MLKEGKTGIQFESVDLKITCGQDWLRGYVTCAGTQGPTLRRGPQLS